MSKTLECNLNNKYSATLTEEEVIAIRHRRAEGELVKHLAAEYIISIQNIYAIVNRRSWKDVE